MLRTGFAHECGEFDRPVSTPTGCRDEHQGSSGRYQFHRRNGDSDAHLGDFVTGRQPQRDLDPLSAVMMRGASECLVIQLELIDMSHSS
ncbi:hypothetical protein B1H29_05335 [Streptomyces pactum]|uniref:Uncharacterized protein n=1 Tax=Streptomyces pactum TaxID=68249 RepID=A0A1S6J3T5_9ACTN|nr:hypothetical protein B1H29_05335 [Streptomyces pactum]